MRTAAITVFAVLALQSGGQIQGADEEPLLVQSATVVDGTADSTAGATADATQPMYCRPFAASDNFTAALLRETDQQLFLESGPGISRADF